MSNIKATNALFVTSEPYMRLGRIGLVTIRDLRRFIEKLSLSAPTEEASKSITLFQFATQESVDSTFLGTYKLCQHRETYKRVIVSGPMG